MPLLPGDTCSQLPAFMRAMRTDASGRSEVYATTCAALCSGGYCKADNVDARDSVSERYLPTTERRRHPPSGVKLVDNLLRCKTQAGARAGGLAGLPRPREGGSEARAARPQRTLSRHSSPSAQPRDQRKVRLG